MTKSVPTVIWSLMPQAFLVSIHFKLTALLQIRNLPFVEVQYFSKKLVVLSASTKDLN